MRHQWRLLCSFPEDSMVFLGHEMAESRLVRPKSRTWSLPNATQQDMGMAAEISAVCLYADRLLAIQTSFACFLVPIFVGWSAVFVGWNPIVCWLISCITKGNNGTILTFTRKNMGKIMVIMICWFFSSGESIQNTWLCHPSRKSGAPDAEMKVQSVQCSAAFFEHPNDRAFVIGATKLIQGRTLVFYGVLRAWRNDWEKNQQSAK